MIVVAGGLRIREDKRDLATKACLAVEAVTRREPGCLSYTFFFGISEPSYLHVFEEWESEEAVSAHLQAAHTQAFLGSIGEFAAGIPVVNKYVVESKASLF